MIFWPLVILAVVLVGVALSGGAGPLGAEDDRTMRLAYLATLGTLLVLGGAGRILIRGGRRALISAAIWVGVFAGLITAYAFRHEARPLIDRVRGELVPSLALSDSSGEAELRRAWDGHYRADVTVNGVPMRLMIDTGATLVLIPYEQAAALGFAPERLAFTQAVSTANGRSTVAPVRLEQIEVGQIRVENVAAAFARPGQLASGLLGMSFLERLEETTFRGDRLILRQGASAVSSGRWIPAPG